MPKKPDTISAKDHRRINGAALRYIRSEVVKMSQDALAQAADLNPSTISRYETEEAFASYDAMYRIAAALRVPLGVITYPVFTAYATPETESVA